MDHGSMIKRPMDMSAIRAHCAAKYGGVGDEDGDDDTAASPPPHAHEDDDGDVQQQQQHLPREDWIATEFGGEAGIAAASNIVFSNGVFVCLFVCLFEM